MAAGNSHQHLTHLINLGLQSHLFETDVFRYSIVSEFECLKVSTFKQRPGIISS